MEQTLFFYDTETSGLNPRRDRIMQLAGQRTNLDFEPIGPPVNLLVSLSNDTLPSPWATAITCITPQQTLSQGMSEPALCQLLQQDLFRPQTTVIGFNNIRFDDEFIRYTFWRNFYDPYAWSWEDGRSRWDLLDVVRMTRALRPQGIEWPTDINGDSVNKLELLAKANRLVHERAHDALSDIEATIAVARLLKQKQPKLFDYLWRMRDKRMVGQLVNLDNRQPFVYTSGRYGKKHKFTTVAYPVCQGSNKSELIVFDARYNPAELKDLTPQQVYDGLFGSAESKEDGPTVPFKRLKPNACPAVAPISVLEVDDGWHSIDLDLQQITNNIKALHSIPHIISLVEEAYASRPEFDSGIDPDEQLYDGFLNEADRRLLPQVRHTDEAGMVDFHPLFADERLSGLLLHYKARNFPESLTYDEQIAWGNYRHDRLMGRAFQYQQDLHDVKQTELSDEQLQALAKLELWAEQIMPRGWQDQD